MKRGSTIPPVGFLGVALASAAMSFFGTHVGISPLAAPYAELGQTLKDPEVSIILPAPKDYSADIDVVSSRPLLMPGRRAQSPVSSVEEPPAIQEATPLVTLEPAQTAISQAEPPSPPDLIMIGAMSAGSVTQVLLRDEFDRSEKWYKTGDLVSGWTLIKVTQVSILLRWGEAETSIMMFD